jgi:hypothetical protein
MFMDRRPLCGSWRRWLKSCSKVPPCARRRPRPCFWGSVASGLVVESFGVQYTVAEEADLDVPWVGGVVVVQEVAEVEGARAGRCIALQGAIAPSFLGTPLVQLAVLPVDVRTELGSRTTLVGLSKNEPGSLPVLHHDGRTGGSLVQHGNAYTSLAVRPTPLCDGVST